MMFDIAKSDDTFGYVYTNPQTGQIASFGTLCKVSNRVLREDGGQFISFNGFDRFQIKRITKTLPYIVAEVEQVFDTAVAYEPAAALLEMEVYNYLKYYMRLLRQIKGNNLVISQSVKDCIPTLREENSDSHTRRTNFSFALASMMQMTVPREAQLLLQTTDLMKRLRTQRSMLMQAVKLIENQLTKAEVLTDTFKERIRMRSFDSEDVGEDIFPRDEESATDDDSGTPQEEDMFGSSSLA